MSATPHRILCATDFSPTGERAKQMAAVLARRFAAELLGSVAERVVRTAPVPLLTVRK
jgi:nucleotide-binding universal stress UspA family protein